MKNKILTLLTLLLILIGYMFYYRSLFLPVERKVLKVVEADKFYIDFNQNNLIDSDELVRLRDVTAFSPVKNPYIVKSSEKLDLKTEDYMKLGYLARNWAKENLEGKIVLIKDDSYNYTRYSKYRTAKIFLNKEDIAEILLKNGLAYPYSINTTYNYIQLYNRTRIESNIQILSKLNFLFQNSYSGKLHKLSCKHIKDIMFGELFLRKQEYENFPKCKVCFEDVKNAVKYISYPKAKNKHNKSIYKKFQNIEIYLINPLEYKYPNNNTAIKKRIIDEINNSKKSIDMALYGFGSQKDVLYALQNAKERGVKVRAVLDYSKKMDEIYPETANFAKEFDAKFDNSETLMHNKFFIFDENKVLTGSMNISSSGSGGYNANIAIIINSAECVKFYQEEFNQMYLGKFQKYKKQIQDKYVNFQNGSVKIYFSPKDDIFKDAILPLIQSAKEEIFVSIFYLTHKTLVEELINARKRGVNVMVISDALAAYQFRDLIYKMRNNGILVKSENWGGKNHEKTIMVDSKILLTGSSNFSNSGFYYNDENVVLINNPDAALLWRDYFLYLFSEIDDKFLYKTPRAEGFESGNSCNDGLDNNFDGKTDGDDDGCVNKIK